MSYPSLSFAGCICSRLAPFRRPRNKNSFGVHETPFLQGKRPHFCFFHFVLFVGPRFGPLLGPEMDSKMVPNVAQNLLKIRRIFGCHLFANLELFRCLLGAFLGLSRLSWTAFEPKILKNTLCVFLRFLHMQVFGTVLMALLARSWPLLGRSGPKMGPSNSSKSCPKVVQKLVQQLSKTLTNQTPNL